METKYLNVNDNGKGLFNTRSGLLVDLNNPTIDMICSEDIAHALNRICRFGGHTMGHYSVGEHSILVAALAPAELKLEALLHDASETYLGDVIKPLKNILGKAYTDIEDRFSSVILRKYNLNKERLKQIKPFDKQALEFEHAAYIMDSYPALQFIQSIIENEIGGKYSPYQIPGIFLNLIKQYSIAAGIGVV
ncbi:hypothetical protein H7F33_05610 [Pedobacter sp. PAMC26386]|nr:hypothetical protein H7F33_05610 [Pedobacter sp. PAMC26386]